MEGFDGILTGISWNYVSVVRFMESYLEYRRDHRGTSAERRSGLCVRFHGAVLEHFQTVVLIGEKGFVERFRAYVGTLLQYGIGFLEYYRICFQSLVAISGRARRI